MSANLNYNRQTIALICLVGIAYVSVSVANAAGNMGDALNDVLKLGLALLLCVTGFLAGRTFLEFTGTTPVFLVGMALMILLHVTELTEEFAVFQPVPLFGEVTLLKRGFETALISGTLCLFLVGIYLSVSSINRTRQEMDAHIARLRESEQRNRRILDTMHDGLAIIDADARFLHVNAAFCGQHGYAPEELGQMEVDQVIQLDHHATFEQFKQDIQRGGCFTGESIDIRKNGSTFHTEVRGTSISLNNRQCFMAMIRDVTQRKQADAELMDYQEKLKTLASELTLTEERLKRTTAEQLHDDIGQLLAFVKMKVQVLHEAHTADSDLARDLTQLRDMLTDILSKVRNLTFELGSRVLSELGLAKAIAAWLEDAVQSTHGIRTAFSDDAQPRALGPDIEAILFRCVKELLSNAIKHAQAQLIEVSISREGNCTVIVVADDGRGFRPQGFTSESPAQEFGLFSVRERLAAMGGELLIDSSSGKGCRATLRAPCGGESHGSQCD